MARSDGEKKPAGGGNPGCGCVAGVLMLLFVLAFAGVGTFGLVSGVGTLARYHAASRWVEVPARIVAARLESETDSDGARLYRVEARYEYEYGGRRYSGRRVEPVGGSDNLDSFPQRASAELARYRDSGRPFRCYVNPARPEEAVLYREIRWGKVALPGIMGVVFSLFGYGVIGWGLVAWRKQRRRRELESRFADRPWKCNPDWAGGTIRAERGQAWLFFGFTVVWNLIVVGFMFAMTRDPLHRAPKMVEVMIFIFMGLGVLMIVGTVRMWLSRLAWGRPTLRLITFPGEIGGTLAGMIATRRTAPPKGELVLGLSCIHRDGEDEKSLWQETKTLRRGTLRPNPGGLVLPVLFQIPETCEPTDAPKQIRWRLDVHAKDDPNMCLARFEVPVYKLDTERRGTPQRLAPASAAGKPYYRDLSIEEALATVKVRVEALPGGETRIICGPAVSGRGWLKLAFWLAVSVALASYLAGHLPGIMPLIIGALGVVVGWVVITWGLSTRQLDIGTREVVLSWRALGRRRVARWPRARVRRLALSRGVEVNGRLHYDLYLESDTGQPRPIVKHMPGLVLAERVAGVIGAAIGCPVDQKKAKVVTGVPGSDADGRRGKPRSG